MIEGPLQYHHGTIAHDRYEGFLQPMRTFLVVPRMQVHREQEQASCSDALRERVAAVVGELDAAPAAPPIDR